MKFIIRTSLAVFFLTLFGISQGQELLTLDEVVQQTLENNYRIKIASRIAKREEIKATRGNAGQLPNVSVGSSYGTGRNNIKQETLEKRRTQQINLRGVINVDYTIFDGFAMFHRYNLLTSTVELSGLNQREAIENIISQTISNYMEVLRFQQQYIVLKESLEASRSRYDFVYKQVKAGTRTRLDELNAQVDMINDSSGVVEAELNYKNALYELQYLMGKKSYSNNFSIVNSFELHKTLDLNTMQGSSVKKNIFIQQSNKNIDISILQYKLAEASRYPTITLNGNYSRNRTEDPLDFLGSNRRSSLSAQVRLSFDLFNGGRKKITQKAAKIDWNNTVIRKEDMKQMISKDLLIAYQNYETRLKVLELLKGNIVNAEENFKNSKKSYNAGIITSLELRQAQVNLASAKNRINNAKINAKLAEVNLKRLAGVLLE